MANPPRSTAEDLTQLEREYAEAIATLSKIDVVDAERRVRLWKTDPVLKAKMMEAASELGPDVVVTNAQWTGPTMTDVEISVVPRPSTRPGPPPGTRFLRSSSDGPRPPTPDEQARAAMRARVAEFELRSAGLGRAHTALSSGLVRL